MLLILPCVVLASFLSTTVAWHHSRPAPSSVPPPPHCSPSTRSRVPSPPFCSRSVATTIWSALLSLISLMKDAWGQGSAIVAFTRQNDAHFWNVRNLWWKVLWTIVLGLNPIVGTFYVFQTMFVTCKFLQILRQQGMGDAVHTEIAKAIADTWVTVGVANANRIPDEYRLNLAEANPDPDNVLNLAGTGDPRRDRQWPTASSFHFFLLNYEGMLALLSSRVLAHTDYQQLRFLGRRTGLETGIIILQSMSYIIAVVYRRIQHLNVTPIEGIGFAGSLLFLVYAFVQCAFGSRSKQGLLIYLTPAQEDTIQEHWNTNQETPWADGTNCDNRALILTGLLGLLVVGVATWLVHPVLTTNNTVDMLGHIIFFGDFFFQFILFILYFKECFGTGLHTNLLLTNLLITGIIASAGVALAIYATIRHWHDEKFDIPTPSLGRYFPFIR